MMPWHFLQVFEATNFSHSFELESDDDSDSDDGDWILIDIDYMLITD